jgi:transcriptional regulator with XRE-family HTH domain
MTTIERILQLQEESGLNNKALEVAVGLTNSSITSWKKGRYAPSAEAIVKLAQFFHVTTDYLLCVSDSKISELVISLSPKEQILIDAYRSASDEGQFNIIQVCMNEKEKRKI